MCTHAEGAEHAPSPPSGLSPTAQGRHSRSIRLLGGTRNALLPLRLMALAALLGASARRLRSPLRTASAFGTDYVLTSRKATSRPQLLGSRPLVLRKSTPHSIRAPSVWRLRSSTTPETATTESVIQTEQPSIGFPVGREPLQELSLELRTLTGHLPVVLSHLKARRASDDTLQAAEQLAKDAEERSRLIGDKDQYLAERKEASALVGRLLGKSSTEDRSLEDEQQLQEAKERSQKAADGASQVDDQLQALQLRMDAQLARLPNLLDDRVPDGDTDSDNTVVGTWGNVQDLPKQLGWPSDFAPLWHDDVATKLGGYRAEAAVKLSGARFVALSGQVARLERALANFFVDLHTSEEHGYTEVSVPLVVGRSTLEGTSQLPKFQEDLFAISPTSHTCNGEDAFLIPTAEVPVTNLHRDTVLEESDLPLCYVAVTPCFRAEAGSYGRDTRGLIRTHQFLKVELVQITTPESSDEQHEKLTRHAENCLRALHLPYRKVRLCSGDIGFAARHCYDLEVWLPGAGEYREISSCSNCGDFQARRMGLRYRPATTEAKGKKKSKPQLCHTLNGSGLAVGRALVAVLENYQRPDGSVVIPEVLRPYMGGAEVLEIPK